MKQKLMACLVCICCLGMAFPAFVVGQNQIREEFNSNDRGWWVGQDFKTGYFAEIKEGSYFVSSGTPVLVVGANFPELAQKKAYSIEMTILMLNGEPTQSYGFSLGDYRTGNEIDFCLNNGGVFIRQMVDGKLSFIRGGGEPCPPKGVGEQLLPDCFLNKFTPSGSLPNRFSIVKKGNNYRFLLNGKQIKEATISQDLKPFLGLKVWNGVAVEVKEIVIEIPDAADQPVAATHATAAPTKGLVSFYPLEGNAKDAAGQGFDGVIVGATACPDVQRNPGAALCLDGSDDHVDFGDINSFQGRSTMSMSVWIRSDREHEMNMILSKYQSNLGPGGLQFYVNEAHGLVVFFSDAQDRRLVCETGANVIQPHAWTHLAFSFDGGSSTLENRVVVAVDGKKVATKLSANTAFSAVPTNNKRFRIGMAQFSNGSASYFQGAIDDLRIYDHVLQDAELSALGTALPVATQQANAASTPAPVPHPAAQPTVVPYLVSEDVWVFIDSTTLKQVGRHSYESASFFEEGTAIVRGEYGLNLVNLQGEELCTSPYGAITYLSEGRIAVERDDRWGYIDLTGKEVIPLSYEYAGGVDEEGEIDDEEYEFFLQLTAFSEGKAAVYKNGKFGYIDASGKVIVPPQYAIAYPFIEGMGLVGDGANWGAVDASGKLVIPIIYPKLEPFMQGLALARTNDLQWRFLRKDGSVKFSPDFDEVESFHCGLAKVDKGVQECGFIDQNGNIVVKPIYESADNFVNDYAVVELNGKYGAIDRTGKVVVPLSYEYLDACQEGLFAFKRDDLYGFVNTQGIEVIPPKFKLVNSFFHGLAIVQDRNTKYGVINLSGEYVIQPEFVVLRVENASFYTGRREWMGTMYPIDRTGREYHKKIE